MTDTESKTFKQMIEDLLGTRGAYLLDPKLNILGKVPLTELISTMKSLGSGVYAIVLDGAVDSELVGVAERGNVQFVICMDSKVKDARLSIKTADQLE